MSTEQLETVEPDSTPEGADWIKKTWDLPPYQSEEFFQIIHPDQLPQFRQSEAYKNAVAEGLIMDDEWIGHIEAA